MRADVGLVEACEGCIDPPGGGGGSSFCWCVEVLCDSSRAHDIRGQQTHSAIRKSSYAVREEEEEENDEGEEPARGDAKKQALQSP